MKKILALVIVAGLLIAAVPALSPQVEAAVYNYAITSVTRTGPDQVTVNLQVRFCSGCNPNVLSSPGCYEFTHGYPPPYYPYTYWCGGLIGGRYVAVRLKDEAGNILGTPQKLVCNQVNWPLNELVNRDFVFSGISLVGITTVTAEADVYCSWCGHWYPQPRSMDVGALRVCIDAGHGGTDLGVLGWSGSTPDTATFPCEKWITLEIAQNLERLLKARDFKTHMTRTTDTDVSPEQRCSIANNNCCDVFVSIHASGSSDYFFQPRRGIVTRHIPFFLPGCLLSYDLARHVQSELVKSTGLVNLGTFQSSSYELTNAEMTPALTQVGYLTNKYDFDFLTNERQRSRIIETARKQLGKKYILGASGPNAFDCSGLVYYSYSKEGADIPRTSASYYYQNYCDHFDSVENLIPGDLLFIYGFTERLGWDVYHVGILSDRNTVIHATSRPGVNKVVEEPITADWNRFGRMKPQYKVFTHLEEAAQGILDGIERHFAARGLTITAECPVDLVATDPDGLRICRDFTEIPGASYLETAIDGDQGVRIRIPDRKIGDYLIEVVPKPDALPTDTFTLEISLFGESMIIARNVQVSDMPTEPYVIVSTETGIVPPIIPTEIDFDPDVLNLGTRGGVVTVYIELPEDYDVGQIDVSSIRLNGTVPALEWPNEMGDYNDNGIPDLMVKFDRTAVHAVVEVGESVEITVTGEVDGIPFSGTDMIRVIGP